MQSEHNKIIELKKISDSIYRIEILPDCCFTGLRIKNGSLKKSLGRGYILD